MTRNLYEIAADIVEAQALFTQMSPDSFEQALSRIFVTLQQLKHAEDKGIPLETPEPSRRTAQRLFREYRTKKLFRHPKPLPMQPFPIVSYTAARKLGLPKEPLQFRRVLCRHYSVCLDQAVKRGWAFFSCHACDDYQKEIQEKLMLDSDRCRLLLSELVRHRKKGKQRRKQVRSISVDSIPPSDEVENHNWGTGAEPL